MANKLSPSMLRALVNVFKGRSISYHCRSQSDYGGLDGTVRALVKRGLLTWEHELTEAGKEAVRKFSESG